MIKFFRNIRKALLMENKTSKYLKYAIGEIVLVVIGILIALQINNWNNDRQEHNRKEIIMSELRKDFEYNKEQLDYIYNGHHKAMVNLKKAIDMFPILDTANLDSLSYYMTEGGVLNWFTYNPRNGVINSLINTSSFELIDNQELRSLIVGWEDVVSDYTEDEIKANDFLSDILNPYTFKYFDYDFDLSNPKSDLKELKSLEFENLLKERYSQLNYLTEAGDNNDYLKLKEVIKRILELTN